MSKKHKTEIEYTVADFDEIIEEHISDNVLSEDPDLPHLTPVEWEEGPAFIELYCGCDVPIDTGDTLWVVEEEDELVPVAIDPVTIH